jgi:putative transposase
VDAARYVYNYALEQMGNGRGAYEIINELPALKKEHEFLKLASAHMLQRVVLQLFNNVSSLMVARKKGRRAGKLRFKNVQRFRSVRYNSEGYHVDREKRTVRLSKIGMMKFDAHREVPDDVSGVVLKHSGDKWYVIFQCEVPGVPEHFDEENIIGLDVGVKSFVHDSEGNIVENSKFLARRLDRLKFLQKSLSRKEKGSNNRDKARRLVARLHEKVKNIRNDRNHQVSRRYINAYDLIVVEDLNIPQMVDRQRKIKKMSSAAIRTLRRNVHDAAWGDFIRKLEYKAEGAGKRVVRIEAENTTQACSNCGNIVYKNIAERTHECPYCGLVLDRDENAALNILLKGIAILRRAGNRPEPAERGVTTACESSKCLSKKQEANGLQAVVVHR